MFEETLLLTSVNLTDTRGGAGLGTQIIPAAPTSLTATADSDSINLAWTRVGTYDNILIDRKSTGAYAQLVSISTAASYDDTTAVAGIAYTYRVRGQRTGYPSPYSNESSATIAANPSSPPPSNLTATGNVGGQSIDLTWVRTQPDFAINYPSGTIRIQRKDSGAFALLDGSDPADSTYSDTSVASGVNYTYRVAYEINPPDPTGDVWSNEASATVNY
jgi:hypothetical protein